MNYLKTFYIRLLINRLRRVLKRINHPFILDVSKDGREWFGYNQTEAADIAQIGRGYSVLDVTKNGTLSISIHPTFWRWLVYCQGEFCSTGGIIYNVHLSALAQATVHERKSSVLLHNSITFDGTTGEWSHILSSDDVDLLFATIDWLPTYFKGCYDLD